MCKKHIHMTCAEKSIAFLEDMITANEFSCTPCVKEPNFIEENPDEDSASNLIQTVQQMCILGPVIEPDIVLIMESDGEPNGDDEQITLDEETAETDVPTVAPNVDDQNHSEKGMWISSSSTQTDPPVPDPCKECINLTTISTKKSNELDAALKELDLTTSRHKGTLTIHRNMFT